MRKSYHIIGISVAMLFTANFLCSCSTVSETKAVPSVSADSQAQAISINAVITKHSKYDVAALDLGPEDLTKAGFSLGDSIDVVFSNGATLTDIPYYNGYYVKIGEPVIVAYPGDDYALIAYNFGDLWTDLDLSNGMTAKLTLNTSEKYLATSEALGKTYSLDRSDYTSDEQFANFRAVKGGNLKENYLYRGASPVDNSKGRVAYANALIEKYNISCIIDLADSDEDMTSYFEDTDFDSDYAQKLYENGKTAVLDLSASYTKDEYKQQVVKGLEKLLEAKGPAYIHCLEGKDRTGFVCALIEALAGASYAEMLEDYMITYANYYGVTADGTPDQYEAIASLNFDSFWEFLSGKSNIAALPTIEFTDYARQYLMDGGMNEAEIDELLAVITE